MNTAAAYELPPGVQVLERGWLSANNIVLAVRPGQAGVATVVDTGYHTHAAQTVALVEAALAGAPLARIANTHLHSDHCGGNAALKARWPAARIAIAPGEASAIAAWDEARLSYAPTGQHCPRFAFDELLEPGTETQLGELPWQVHAAPGHDTHSVILFEPHSRTLVSADALWENGFGVVFPEIDGLAAFDAVAATLDVIERLQPRTVIPGHGAVFTDVATALANARRRLDSFVASPGRHAMHAAKVLLKYKLLEWQSLPLAEVHAWLSATLVFQLLHERHFAGTAPDAWHAQLIDELVRSGVALREQGRLVNQ
ncbi:MAG: MBL fold metallo-hydrolase [Comamonas sp.]